MASVVCGRCGEWAVAWGLGVDGLEDVAFVGLLGALVPDGAEARTLVALVAALVPGQGWVVMVATLRVEVEELWCSAPPAAIPATVALPYVPGCGAGTSGWRARRATGTGLWGGVSPSTLDRRPSASRVPPWSCPR